VKKRFAGICKGRDLVEAMTQAAKEAGWGKKEVRGNDKETKTKRNRV